MAEGNGEIMEEMTTAVKTAEPTVETERTADYPKLVEYGLDKRVSVAPIACINSNFDCLFFFLSRMHI